MTYKLSNRPINNFSPATSRSYQSQIIELELRLTSTKLRVTKIKHFKVVKKNWSQINIWSPTLFISLRIVYAMLPITVKNAVILKLELVNAQVFHL